MTITDIAATVGMSRRHAYKWIQRFMQDGVEGLIDRPQRRGHNFLAYFFKSLGRQFHITVKNDQP